MVKKRFVALIVFGLLVCIIIVVFLSRPSISKRSEVDEIVASTQSMKTADEDPSVATSSRYITYSPTALQNTSGKKRVLFFYASWCPTCRPADKEFQSNAERIPEEIQLFRVNYNDSDTDASEKELARQYGVTYQHTFVLIDGDGKEIKKWNGGQLEELLENSK